MIVLWTDSMVLTQNIASVGNVFFQRTLNLSNNFLDRKVISDQVTYFLMLNI